MRRQARWAVIENVIWLDWRGGTLALLSGYVARANGARAEVVTCLRRWQGMACGTSPERKRHFRLTRGTSRRLWATCPRPGTVKSEQTTPPFDPTTAGSRAALPLPMS
jgi:hypothetical protein